MIIEQKIPEDGHEMEYWVITPEGNRERLTDFNIGRVCAYLGTSPSAMAKRLSTSHGTLMRRGFVHDDPENPEPLPIYNQFAESLYVMVTRYNLRNVEWYFKNNPDSLKMMGIVDGVTFHVPYSN